MQQEQFYYDNKIVRNFAYASIIFGLIGMTVGLLIATNKLIPIKRTNTAICYSSAVKKRDIFSKKYDINHIIN